MSPTAFFLNVYFGDSSATALVTAFLKTVQSKTKNKTEGINLKLQIFDIAIAHYRLPIRICK